MRGYATVYRRENAEKVRAGQSAYRAIPGNRELARRRTAEWRAANPGRASAAMRKRYLLNRARLIAASIRWQRENPDKVATRRHNYVARKKAGGARLSHGLVRTLLLEQNGKCCYCAEEFAGSRFHLDHYMPLALGGRNQDENIVLACPSCNCSKRHQHPLAFLHRRGLWHERHVPTERPDDPH